METTRTTKPDRRSRRSQQLLGNALVDLMLEKQFDAITVQDILDRANVGRSTFYSHFSSKEDLLYSSVGQMLNGLDLHTVDGNTSPHLLPSLALFRHVKEHQRLYKALVWGSQIDLTSRTLKGQLRQLVERNLAALLPAGGTMRVPLPVLADFVAGAFLTLLQWWMESNSHYSAEQIDVMFRQMVLPGVQNALGPRLER